MKYKIVNGLLMPLLVISFVSCCEISSGIHKNLIITDIGRHECELCTEKGGFRVNFNEMASNGDKYHKIAILKISNLYDLSLLNDLKAQKLISDSLARKGLTRLLDIDFDDRKIINISDYSSDELIDKLRSDLLLSSPADTEDIKKSDENEDKDEHDTVVISTVTILLIVLVIMYAVHIIVKVIQMREYKNEIERTASEISSIINMKNKSIDPDKDLRTNLMILGYDPKVVNDIIDEVNKEIK